MENKERLKPLTMEQRKFAEDNYRLIMEFLKKSKLDSEEYFDVAVLVIYYQWKYIWMILIYSGNANSKQFHICTWEEKCIYISGHRREIQLSEIIQV